jgi:hypothetical protein
MTLDALRLTHAAAMTLNPKQQRNAVFVGAAFYAAASAPAEYVISISSVVPHPRSFWCFLSSSVYGD